MLRGLSLVSLLVALLAAGWLLTAQRAHSPSARSADRAVDQAQQAAVELTFQQAETQLEQFHALNGTYAGASTAGFGVTLARADASSYCLEADANGQAFHLAGPGGGAAAGRC